MPANPPPMMAMRLGGGSPGGATLERGTRRFFVFGAKWCSEREAAPRRSDGIESGAANAVCALSALPMSDCR